MNSERPDLDLIRDRLDHVGEVHPHIGEWIDDAIRAGLSDLEISRRTGRDRKGIWDRRNRLKETPMRTLTIDATAGAVQAVMADLWPGEMQPGVGGGALVEVTLPEPKAVELESELLRRDYPVF